MTSPVSLPLVTWQNFCNPNVTCTAYSNSTIYTGQKDGHIWVYSVKDRSTLKHKMLLVGHKKAVVALCITHTKTDTSLKADVLLSASEDGEIIRWDTSDGKCQATNPNGFLGIPRSIKVFPQISTQDVFCCGQANEISVLNLTTLEVIRVWGGHSSWVTCMDLDEKSDSGSPRLMTVDMKGGLDIWDFETSKHVIYKIQSIAHKILQDAACSSTLSLLRSTQSSKLFMVLTSSSILIMAIYNNEFVPQFIVPSDPETKWEGGRFFEKDRVIVWSSSGDIFDYRLRESAADNNRHSATLVHSYHLDKQNFMLSESVKITLFEQEGELFAFVISNHPENAKFCILHLLSKQKEASSAYKICSALKDLWPIKNQMDTAFGQITVIEPIDASHLAIGYDTGKICIAPLSMALLHLYDLSSRVNECNNIQILRKSHHGAITCMIIPKRLVSSQQYLISGGADGVVKIWNLADWKYVASCAAHSTPIVSFIEPVEKKDARIRGCIVSIAEDNSVALISLDSMSCLFIFPGYPHPLKAIQWRAAEDFLVLGYSDDSAYVWQMQTAHLDRELHGKSMLDVINDNRWPINHVVSSKITSSVAQSKQKLHIRAIMSNCYGFQTQSSFAQVFTFNIRRLTQGLKMPLIEDQEIEHHPYPKALTDVKNDTKCAQEALDETSEKTIELVKVLISLISSWNVNDAVEAVYSQFIEPKKSFRHNISYGIKGSNGYLSLMAPVECEKKLWEASPSITAIRLLSISLLSKTVIFLAGQESKHIDLLAGYAMSLPLVIGKDYCFPSLPLLSKHWQDPVARSLFSSTIENLSEQDLNSIIQYWEELLPVNSKENNSQMSVRSTIILGVIGCDQPDALASHVRRATALSLTSLLSDVESESLNVGNGMLSSSSINRALSSMELLTQGFKTWEKHMNGTELMRTLFMYASDSRPAMNSLKSSATTAIFRISIFNMPLVISTLTMDIIQSKSLDLRLRCLKIIGTFIKKEPIILYSYVHNIIEAVVKTLDPNVPHMREAMIQSTTSVLHDLVTTYPSIDFSSTTQKLAIGTLEGASVVYDLRTITRSIVLEGHTGPVVALAFSPDAKLIATCSLFDQSVRVWHTNMSLFGMIASSLVTNGQQNKNTSGTHKPDKVFEFALPNNSLTPSDIIKQVGFEWNTCHCVKLKICDLVMSFNV